jgi:hypothetical protein
MFSSNFKAFNIDSSTKNAGEVIAMSNTNSSKNDIISRISVRSVALAGAAAIAISAAFGSSTAIHADGFEFTPEWRTHLEADAYEMAGNPAYVVAQPFQLSPEWKAHLDADAYQVAGDSVTVILEAPDYEGDMAVQAALSRRKAENGQTVELPSALRQAAATSTDSAGLSDHGTLSPEWAAHLERDDFEMAGRAANVIAQPFKLSPEWTAHIERDAF